MKTILIVLFATGLFACRAADAQEHAIRKGGVVYDFTFADLAAEYLETADTARLSRIAGLDAMRHILNHASRFGGDTESTGATMARELLSPIEEHRERLQLFERNVEYAKHLAGTDLPQTVALQYLPSDFHYSSALYFTFGYDLGVAYGPNASVNLAHPHYLNDVNEIRYYSIHELHHAGFMMLKNEMPSFDITTRGEMARIIEFCTQLEGMATYAPLELRIREGMEADDDYVVLQDPALMQEYEKEYFDIYFHFKNSPNETLTDEDWGRMRILSNGKRLWYRVGAHMARTIDEKLGREKLVGLIAEPSENFVTTYLEVK